MGLVSALRRRSVEAELEGLGVAQPLRGALASAINRYVMEGFLMQTKAGWRTTEFWCHLLLSLGAVGSAIAGSLSPQWAAIVVGVSQAAYSVGRGLAKSGNV